MRKLTLVWAVATTLCATGVVAPEASMAEQVLCLKRRGALVVRDPACKSRETPFDLTAFISAARGTVAGYATIDADGSLVESFSQVGATVTASRNQVGAYSITFGFDVRPDQAILLSTRETFGIELCRVFQGDSPRAVVDVFCATAEPGSPAADVPFTVVVLD